MSDAKKILIIDDSKSIAYKLGKLIEEIPGVEVAGHFLTAEEGIAYYRENPVDLVTMDLILPGMDGIEGISELRKHDPEAKVVVISSIGGDPKRSMAAITAGAKNVIAKPFSKEELRKIFTSLLDV